MRVSTIKHSLDLGHLQLGYRNAGLAVRVSNTATISCLKDVSISIPDSPSIDELIHGFAWASQGSTFRLCLDITWDKEVYIESPRTTLIEYVAAALRDADLWRQLDLTPSLTIEATREENALGRLSLHLSYDHQPGNTARKPPHRLAEGVPCSDVRPPIGILDATLEEVEFHLHVTSSNCARRYRRRNPLHEHQQSALNSIDQHDELLLKRDERDLVEEWDEYVCSSDEDLFEENYDGDFTELQYPENDDLDMFAADLPDADVSQHASSLTFGESAMAFNTDAGIPNLNHPPGRAVINEPTLLALVDAAIRHSVTPAPRRIPAGISVTEIADFKRLADLAPAIFSPKHLPAIATRQVFLPTISHALAHSVLAKAQSDCLRSKVREITRQEGGKGTSTDSDGDLSATMHRTERNAAQQAISVRLWRLMQRGLRDPASERCLQPLTNATPEAQDVVDADAMLSEGLGVCEENTASELWLNDELADDAAWDNELLEDELSLDDDLF